MLITAVVFHQEEQELLTCLEEKLFTVSFNVEPPFATLKAESVIMNLDKV